MASLNSRLWRLLVFICATALAASGMDACRAHAGENPTRNPFLGKTVLVLNSYTNGYGAHERIVEGFYDGIVKEGGHVDTLYIEKLDLLRFYSSDYKKRMVEWLRTKYAGKKFDLVVTMQKPALDFALGEARAFLGDTPIIAAFVVAESSPDKLPDHVAVLPYPVDFSGTLTQALALFPATRRVVTVAGTAEADRIFIGQAKRAFEAWRGKLEFEYLDDGNIQRTQERIQTLPADSIIVMTTFYRDNEGRPYATQNVAAGMIGKANVPIFHLWDSMIGSGVIGGSMVGIEALAGQVAQAAAGYLAGRKSLDEVKREIALDGKATYDWRQLQRWRSKLGNLPADSIFVNRPQTLWDEYRGAVIGTGSVIVLLLVLVVTLVVSNRRREQADARYRTMLERAPEAIIVIDADDFSWVATNPRLFELTGYGPEEIADMRLDGLLAPEQPDGRPVLESIRENARDALAGEEVVVDRAIRHRDGHVLFCEVRIVRLPDPHRNLLRASCVDITSRRQMENELRKKTEELEIDRTWLKTLLETIPDPVWLKDADGIYLECNRTFCELFGKSRDEILGNTDLNIFSADIAGLLREADFKVFNSEMPLRIVELVATSRGETTFDTTKAPMRLPTGEVIGVLGVAHDISKSIAIQRELTNYRDHLENLVEERTAALKIALEAAETANRAKSVFLSNMSHELRTPLNSVIGFSRLLSKSTHLDDKERKNIETINRSGNHLLTLINNVLELSKIEASQANVTEAATDIGELAREVIDMLTPKAEQNGVKLELEEGDTLAVVKVDTVKLRQILINLVGNAIKFTRQGGIGLSIRGRGQIDGNVVVDFAVKDTGIGIATEDQRNIFEPFVQLVTHATSAGTGLGLAITRQYLRMMGSELELASTPGVGSCFSFTLHLPVARTRQTIDTPTKPAVETASIPIRKRILIAEDNECSRELLRELLTPFGFEVIAAEDGMQAVTLTERYLPELIVMDWRMPNMDGLAATRKIRQLGLSVQPRILMLTANAFEEDRREAFSAGVDDYLRKPLEVDAFYAAIEAHLQIGLLRPPLQYPTAPLAEDCPALDATHLTSLSDEQRHALRVAVEELNRAKLNAVLAELSATHPELARTIGTMADRLRYKELWELLGTA